LLSGTVGRLGPHALWGGMPPGTSRIPRPGAWGSLGCVVAGSWHCSKLRGPVGQQGLQACIVWCPQASRGPGCTCLGHGLPGARAAAADMRKQSLWAVGVPGPDFPHRPQEAQICGSAACSREQSLCTTISLSIHGHLVFYIFLIANNASMNMST
jgi:hypothetical protein